jgi:hypothetical protein
MIKIDDYYLDIKLVFSLDKDKREMIINYYDRLLDSVSMGDKSRVNSLFNTLIRTDFLKNIIEENRTIKLDSIIEENEV